MKTLIIFTALFSFQVQADEAQALRYLASQGLAQDHYPAYQFHYTNQPTATDQTARAYQELSRDNAIMNQGYNQPAPTKYCYYDYSINNTVCN